MISAVYSNVEHFCVSHFNCVQPDVTFCVSETGKIDALKPSEVPDSARCKALSIQTWTVYG